MIGNILLKTVATLGVCLAIVLKYQTMYKLDFKTQYNQFYICDKSSPQNTGSKFFWTDEAYNKRLAIEDGILGVGTECYGHVKGEIHILQKKNTEIVYKDYDHVVEGGLEIKSGVLQVLDCPNSKLELEIKMKPGRYRIRVLSSNLASVDMDENEGNDYYKIEIWPDNVISRKVLKQYKTSL